MVSGTRASPVKSVHAGVQSGGNHARSGWRVLAVCALGSILVAGIGFAVLLMKSPDGISTVRPSEVVRIEWAAPKPAASKNKPAPVEVPAPQGTINRMNAIRESFSK